MKKIQYFITSLFLVSVLFTSCNKEYVDPEPRTIQTGTVMTIAEVRALYEPGVEVKITEDISVYGVVTMDESTGNLYKESYITDATGNLYLRFISSSGLYTGDSIRVNLNGAKIIRYNQMLQIDSLHPDNNIVKISTQNYKTPEIVTIADLLADMEAAQGKLVQINYTKFVDGGQGLTYADAANLLDVSRPLQDLNGGLIDVRTSGYANFANDTIPAGVGSFIGIVAQYGSGLQLLVRNPNELDLTGAVPVLALAKNFDDQSLTSGGWTTQLISGIASTSWGIYAATNSAAKISNNPNLACESWLISPAIDLTGGTNSNMNFLSTIRFDSGPQLQLMVSTNYSGTGDPNLATWTDITTSAIWDTDINSWTFIPSGSIDLSAFSQAGVYVAFKFVGTATTSVTWEIDDIKIYK